MQVDIGAYRGSEPMKGPSFRHLDGDTGADTVYIERPRITNVDLARLPSGRFSVAFSVPIALNEPTMSIFLRLKSGEENISATCALDNRDARAVNCSLSDSDVRDAEIAEIRLPRDIRRRDGARAPVTLWARGDARVRFLD